MKELVVGHKYSIKSVDCRGQTWEGTAMFLKMAGDDYVKGTGEFYCEDELGRNEGTSGFFGIEEIKGEILTEEVDKLKIKPINSIKDLVVNKKYFINSVREDGQPIWKGVVTCQQTVNKELPDGGCGVFVCEDGLQCNFKFDQIVGELIEDPSVTKERHRCIQAVRDELELPDEMSDEVWDSISKDRDVATEFCRMIVRATKAGIIGRIENKGGK